MLLPLIAAVALLAPVGSAFAVNTCGGEVHINNCGVATHPFPCCTASDGSQSNCTWWEQVLRDDLWARRLRHRLERHL